LVNYFYEKNFRTHKVITILLYYAGIKPAFKVEIHKSTHGKHIPHLRNALNETDNYWHTPVLGTLRNHGLQI